VPSHIQSRQATPTVCPAYQCSISGGTCSSMTPCQTCLTNYQNCAIVAGGNGTEQCKCIIQEISCLKQFPVCFQNTITAVQSCLQFYTGAIYGNCSGQCNGLTPNVGIIQQCALGAGIGCNAAGNCVPLHTSGTCTGPADLTCGDPAGNYYSIYNIYSCQNSTNGYNCAQTPGIHILGSANDGCITNLDCFDGIPCVGGICQGTKIGGACQTSGSCVFGAFCFNQNCTAQIPNGGNCSGIPGGCMVGSTCGLKAVCVPQLTVPVGGVCANSLECQAGLYCSPANFKCVTPPANLPCQQTADCGNTQQGICNCNLDGTKSCSVGPLSFSFPATCVQYFDMLVSCSNQYQCKNSLAPTSCMARNCPKTVNCYGSCALKVLSSIGVPNNCYSTVNLPCNNPASIITFGGWVLLAGFLVSILL